MKTSINPILLSASIFVGLLSGGAMAIAQTSPPESVQEESQSAEMQAEDLPADAEAETLASGPLSLSDAVPGIQLVLRHNPFVFGAPTTQGGDITTRTQILGDWGGTRQRAVDRGVFFDLYSTTIIQGSFDEDGSGNSAISEHLDAVLNLDTGRLGWWPGGMWQFTLQGKFGSDINAETGALSPVNTAANWPTPDDENVVLVTEYFLFQALTPQLTAIIGKLNATNFADVNLFANDYRYQFQNFSLNNNLMLGGFVPEVAWGALLSYQPTPWLVISTGVLDPNSSADNFADDFFKDITVAQEFAFSYAIEERPGNFRFGWLWGTRDRLDLTNPVSLFGDDGRLDFRDPFQTVDSSYMLYANFDQYFFTVDPNPAVVSTEVSTDPESSGAEAVPTGPIFATPRGLGAFGRLGFGPSDSNLVNFFASAGIGGKGLIPGRPYDQFGLGWYHLNFSQDLEDTLNSRRLLVFLNRGEFDLQSENGIEIYYTAAITPAIQLTADVQYIIEPGLSRADSVLIAGGRLQLNF